MKYIDPTEARKARDDEDRRNGVRLTKAKAPEASKPKGGALSSGKGMKANAAVYRYAAKNPRKVL